MNQYDKFHEYEIIVLRSDKMLSLKNLRTCLFKLNFEEMDDFFFIDREHEAQPWQSINLAHINVKNSSTNNTLNLIEEEPWDTLELEYLFASMPFIYTNKFLDIVYNIAESLNLIVEHSGSVRTKDELFMLFHEYKLDVENVLHGEPGSKIVGVTISMSYPR